MSKRRIHGFRDSDKIVLDLTKQEIILLDSAFRNGKSVAWPRNMFANSIMLATDSLKLFIESTKERSFFEKSNARKYFFFSTPVFFRDNTLAVFRLVEMYGPSSGYDLLFFYQKKANNWEQYMHVYSGAW
jgi:hypothetical protein